MDDSEARRRYNLAAVEEFVAAASARDVDRFMALWGADCTWEFPFGQPYRAMRGRTEIASFIQQLFEAMKRIAFEDLQLYPAVDPDLIFATYSGDIETAATGRPYRNTYIAMFRFEYGKLAAVREYFNPLVVAEAFGANTSTNS